MLRHLLLRAAVVSGLCGAASAVGKDAWSQLKPGMSRGETVAVLGAELTASKGRGFEVAIYDHKAEVVFLNGQLVAWTAPASSQAAPPPSDTWQFDQVPQVRGSARRTIESGSVRSRAGMILPAYRL